MHVAQQQMFSVPNNKGGKMKITNEMVGVWLGTSNQLNEAIDVIQEIVNGEYTVEALNQDITEFFGEELRLRSK